MYAEPFALRALGLVRGDDEFVTRAQERFRAWGSTGTGTDGRACASLDVAVSREG
jgi:hypothetical protein